jgi:hypothetical protein
MLRWSGRDRPIYRFNLLCSACIMANTLYMQALEAAKNTANVQVIQAFQQIQGTLIGSITNLRSAGQSTTINVDKIVDDLNQARDEWLKSR